MTKTVSLLALLFVIVIGALSIFIIDNHYNNAIKYSTELSNMKMQKNISISEKNHYKRMATLNRTIFGEIK